MTRTGFPEPIDASWFEGLFEQVDVCRSDLRRWQQTLRYAARVLADPAPCPADLGEHLERLTDPDEHPDQRHHRTLERRRTADRGRLLAVADEIHRHLVSNPRLAPVGERHTDEMGEFIP